jgi:hypothetical protein
MAQLSKIIALRRYGLGHVVWLEITVGRIRRSPGRSPKSQTTTPPFGGLAEVIQMPRKSGAGEGARTLDPDLGKVVLYH